MEVWRTDFIGSRLTVFTNPVVNFLAVLLNQLFDAGESKEVVLVMRLYGYAVMRFYEGEKERKREEEVVKLECICEQTTSCSKHRTRAYETRDNPEDHSTNYDK